MNALAWTKQMQPENKIALVAHNNAVNQIEFELAQLKGEDDE